MPDLDRPPAPWLKAALLGLALVAALVLVQPPDALRSLRRTLGMPAERVLPAPEVPARAGDFVFAMTQSGSSDPVGWDPCETIRYSINPEGEPEGGRALVERALERTSAATGLAFEDVGETDRRPFSGQLVPADGSPVVIGWADAGQVPELAGPVAGLGGGSAPEASGTRYYVTGGVVLDTDAFTRDAIARSPRVMEALVVHEVAHLVGLGHVNEPMELMFASNDGQVDFGPGDLAGLATLGSLPCR